MAINQCAPCSDPCYLSAAANSQGSFFSAVLNILCGMQAAASPTSADLIRINGTYNGAAQEVVPIQGAGLAIRVRSILVGTGDVNTDWQFFSKSAGAVLTALTPNYDYLSNAGAMGNVNPDGWVQTLPGESLVITTNNPVDLLGTAVAVIA